MTDRFYCPQLPTQLGDLIELPDDEAHHASRVLRKASGDEVELFDGAGGVAPAVLVDVRKKGVTAELAGPLVSSPSRAQQLTIATAVPKADRFKWLVEKATELGVDAIVPLECERSVVHPGGSKIEKMRQTVVAACKQSGRNRLMTISVPQTFEQAISTSADLRVIADVPYKDHQPAPSGSAETTSILAVVGPEGGWTDAERHAGLAAGFQTLQIGAHVLRTETAAIAVAACFSGQVR